MSISNSCDFSDFQLNYEHSLREYNAASHNLAKAKNLRDDNCPHEIISKKSYNVAGGYLTRGGYLDRGYSDHWNQCDLCGNKSEMIRKQDGSFE